MKGNSLIALFWAVIAAHFVCDSVSGSCGSFLGPGGDVDCVKLSGYSGYQIAACRSDSYVKRVSGNKYSCGYFSISQYCYYQCMLDLYGKTSGEIYKRCRCDPTDHRSPRYPSSGGITPSSPEPITPFNVPSECYRPDDNDCSWYKLCLNRAFPSCDRGNERTFKFLTKFCNLSQEKLNVLSASGKQWLDDTGKCVKRKLATLLGTDKQVKNCEHIRTTALERYGQCYREQSSRFCDLSEKDRMGLFWHLVHNSSSDNRNENGLKKDLDLMRECRDNTKDNVLVQKLKEKIEKKEQEADIVPRVSKELQIAEVRIKAWLEDPPVTPIQVDIALTKNSWLPGGSFNDLDSRSSYAAKIVQELASFGKWKDKEVVWFAFAMNDGENTHIRLLLDDRCRLDNALSCRADLGVILVGLSKSVLNKNLHVKVDSYDAEIITLTGCLDTNCKEHAFIVGEQTNCKTENGVVTCGAADTLRSMRMLSFVFSFLLVNNFLF